MGALGSHSSRVSYMSCAERIKQKQGCIKKNYVSAHIMAKHAFYNEN